MARALVRYGVRVFVHEAGEARSDEAKAERALALPDVDARGVCPRRASSSTRCSASARRGRHAETSRNASRTSLGARERGATVVALDIPSGVDADTGIAIDAVRADLTITFGTLKRGLAIARGNAGRISSSTSGSDRRRRDDGMPRLVDAQWVRAHVPPIHADAHKGTRRKLIIIGGQLGMAGAPMLAARAAMRSGIGMVRLVVARDNLPVVQAAVPEAPAHAWPETDADVASVITEWADAVVIGPGLGASYGSRALVERVLRGYRGPVVLDADALNAFAGEAEQLGALIGDRQALLTPHPAEFARLLGGHDQ